MSEVTIEELRAKGQVIEYKTPGNILYAGLGRPCPSCKKVWFSSSYDLGLHKRVCKGEWQTSKFNREEEWCPAEKDPELRLSLQQSGGSLELGFWKYSLSQNGKYLKRKRAVNTI
ncbi:hypothetical protein MUP77_07635 [Candidatus Bathyarchaeota archaeon]|nr:hypothetical protein [Candidatus Bathyarchaeota archaeon]